jgi:hypothetical protein
MHVGDLDGSAVISGSTWTASVSILVHDELEAPLAGVEVEAKWSVNATGNNQDVSCTTGASGRCTMDSGWLEASADSTTLTLKNNGLKKSDYTYDRSANHDPDGCETSSCDSITVTHTALSGKKENNYLQITPSGMQSTPTPGAQSGKTRQSPPDVHIDLPAFQVAPRDAAPVKPTPPESSAPGQAQPNIPAAETAGSPLALLPAVFCLWGIALVERKAV